MSCKIFRHINLLLDGNTWAFYDCLLQSYRHSYFLKTFFIIYVIYFMALKETELTETSSGWEPLQFYCLTRATFKRRTPPHLKVYNMTRRPMLLYYIYISTRPRIGSCHKSGFDAYQVSSY